MSDPNPGEHQAKSWWRLELRKLFPPKTISSRTTVQHPSQTKWPKLNQVPCRASMLTSKRICALIMVCRSVWNRRRAAIFSHTWCRLRWPINRSQKWCRPLWISPFRLEAPQTGLVWIWRLARATNSRAPRWRSNSIRLVMAALRHWTSNISQSKDLGLLRKQHKIASKNRKRSNKLWIKS